MLPGLIKSASPSRLLQTNATDHIIPTRMMLKRSLACFVLLHHFGAFADPQLAEGHLNEGANTIKTSENVFDNFGSALGGTVQQVLSAFGPVIHQLQAFSPNFLQNPTGMLQAAIPSQSLIGFQPASLSQTQFLPQPQPHVHPRQLRGLSESIGSTPESSPASSEPSRDLFHRHGGGWSGGWGYPGGYGGGYGGGYHYPQAYHGYGYGNPYHGGGYYNGFGGGYFGGYCPGYRCSGWF